MKKSNSRRFIQGISIIFYIACLMMAGGCSKTIYPSVWQPSPIVTDGRLSDWTLPLPYYDTDTKLNYSITNDAQNLYIVFRTSDVQAQMKLLKAGFTLWIDTKGKKNELTGIRYPLPQALLPDHGQSLPTTNNSQHGEKKDMSRAGQRLIAAQKQMELIGFKITSNGGNPNGTTLLRTNEGIAVAMDADSTGELVYEATIPFKTFFKETITAADTLNPISIGMVENGLTMPGGQHKGGGEEGGGGMSGGGGMGGGGMGGGMRGGGGGMGGGGGRGHGSGSRGMSDGSNETKKVWNYIKLTIK